MDETQEVTTREDGRERVIRLASLARLHLTEAEVLAFAPQVDAVLRHVAELQSLDVQGVEPMLSPVSQHAEGLRPDVLRPLPLQREMSEEVLRCAPESREGSFVVPPVL